MIADSLPGSLIEECLVSGLVELWDRIKTIPHFLFVNRERQLVYLGIGVFSPKEPSNLPFFIANKFGDSNYCKKVYPKVLLTTSGCMWPKMNLSIFHEDKEALEISALLGKTSWIIQDASHLIPPCVAFKDAGMNQDEYRDAVNACIQEMKNGELSKVVLARKTAFEMVSEINPYALLLTIMQNTSATDSGKRYTVVYSSPEEGCFVSLTPERFCSVSQTQLETEALAGTCRGEQFDMTDKLSEEHGLVGRFVSDQLSKLRADGCVETTSREFLRLRDMTHCRQRFRVQADTCHGGDLLDWAIENLHPTPAVGGLPKQKAKDLIQNHEKFDRNYFAAPLGFFDPGNQTGELCVALRSALIDKNLVHLFAGAGLVKDSDSQAEWEEMELKMAQFRQVILGVNRPCLSFLKSIKNATHAQSMAVIEELVRQNVTKFIVCPGSRSTPLTVAVRHNSVAHSRAVVVHDERCAGFYAVGVARAQGLAAIIVTSGTAVANLLPAVCEAREAGLALLLLTADRPARSWNVGEFQTIPQNGIFSSFVGYQKNFPAPLSEAGEAFGSNGLVSVVAEVSFAVGDIAKQRNQSVHLNFELEKSELQPDVVEIDFAEKFSSKLNPRLVQYCTTLKPFTVYLRPQPALSVPPAVVDYFRSGKCVIVLGELREPRDAITVSELCDMFDIPCIAEVISLIPSPSPHILVSSDQLLADDNILGAVSQDTHVVIRMGGPLISGRLQDWASTRQKVIRVMDDSFASFRHDPQYAAELYIHSTIADFITNVEEQIQSSDKEFSQSVMRKHTVSKIAACTPTYYKNVLREASAVVPWNEAVIAYALSTVVSELNAAVFLSASMPCRDYAIFGGLISEERAPYRLVAANRGANGIDGVISTATGYAAQTGLTTYVLIGDVATLHDLSGLALALNVQPGSDSGKHPDVRVICVNNAGGAIFSFLPINKHKEVFTPYFDTPHSLKFTQIADGMLDGAAACVKDVASFEIALRDPKIKFIECVCLPDHMKNVELHKLIGSEVSKLVRKHLEQI